MVSAFAFKQSTVGRHETRLAKDGIAEAGWWVYGSAFHQALSLFMLELLH